MMVKKYLTITLICLGLVSAATLVFFGREIDTSEGHDFVYVISNLGDSPKSNLLEENYPVVNGYTKVVLKPEDLSIFPHDHSKSLPWRDETFIAELKNNKIQATQAIYYNSDTKGSIFLNSEELEKIKVNPNIVSNEGYKFVDRGYGFEIDRYSIKNKFGQHLKIEWHPFATSGDTKNLHFVGWVE